MIPDIPKVQKPAWNPEVLQAIHHAQADIEKAISSVRVLGEFLDNPNYWRWKTEDLQKELAILWALEDGLHGRQGIAGYGGWLWPRGNSRPYTTDEHLAMSKVRRMVEQTLTRE